ADAERLAALRQRVEGVLAPWQTWRDVKPYWANLIMWTAHRDAFLPSCFRLLRLPEPAQRGWERSNLLDHVYACSRESPAVHRELVQHLARHGTRWDTKVLERWRVQRVALTKEEVAQLAGSTDV